MKKQGFVFINSLGQYARIYTRNTHGGSQEAVEWVNNLNDAQVFPNTVIMPKRIAELKAATAVKATTTIVVTIESWEAQDGQ